MSENCKKSHKFQPKEFCRGYPIWPDVRSAHVVRGELIGEVTDMYYHEGRSVTLLKVKFFNGEPWPLDPAIWAVEYLEREYEEGE